MFGLFKNKKKANPSSAVALQLIGGPKSLTSLKTLTQSVKDALVAIRTKVAGAVGSLSHEGLTAILANFDVLAGGHLQTLGLLEAGGLKTYTTAILEAKVNALAGVRWILRGKIGFTKATEINQIVLTLRSKLRYLGQSATEADPLRSITLKVDAITRRNEVSLSPRGNVKLSLRDTCKIEIQKLASKLVNAISEVSAHLVTEVTCTYVPGTAGHAPRITVVITSGDDTIEILNGSVDEYDDFFPLCIALNMQMAKNDIALTVDFVDNYEHTIDEIEDAETLEEPAGSENETTATTTSTTDDDTNASTNTASTEEGSNGTTDENLLDTDASSAGADTSEGGGETPPAPGA